MTEDIRGLPAFTRYKPVDLLKGNGGASPATSSEIDADIATHAAAADPHTVYQKESEREAASGYAGLDSNSKVIKDPANATATPTASKIPIADGSGKLDGWITGSGVTNGNTHDHSGGDGAQIDHGGLGGLADDDHPQYALDTDLTTHAALLSTHGLIRSRVSTQFDKSNNDTLGDVTGLTAALGASKNYLFRAVLHVTADVTAGHKYAIAYSSTVTAIVYQINSISNATNLNVINSRQSASGGAAGQAGAATPFTTIEGLITTNGAGNLTVQFAQNTATITTTSSVLVGSTFTVEEIT